MASTPPPHGSVSTTPPRALAVAALFGGLTGWLIVVIANATGSFPPRIPWTGPMGIVLIGALVGALAYSTRRRIQIRRERMDPQRAVAFLVLGKASALAGALVAGAYLGFALNFVGRLDVSAPRERVIRSAVAIVAGVALTIAGMLLERACKVPNDPDEKTDSD